MENQRFVTVRTFLRALGAVYLAAFLSFGYQASGLIGSRGILPFVNYLTYIHEQLGAAAYREVPTVLWLSWTDGALSAVWILGSVCALAAVFGWRQRVMLGGCLVLWLSICSVGQDFLSFQWDSLLIEAGFLALFADRTGPRVLLFRWLLFRLMFSSGLVKLASHDLTWQNLTALGFHYETQPLPTPLAWYMAQLPAWFQRASTFVVLATELGVPFLYFLPRPARRVGAWVTIGLQTLILLTGNYAFFNWLTLALTLFLFIEPDGWGLNRGHRIVSAAPVAFIGISSGMLVCNLSSLPLPEPAVDIERAIQPFQLVNPYGLFAVMTTERDEIVMEGSRDGITWLAYEFPDKPGDLNRAPPIIAPCQPRLDWQMWFAALGTYGGDRWFSNFAVRLLQGEPAVLRLLHGNPFPDGPPKYIRAHRWRYRFTTFGSRDWWKREDQGLYMPPVSLR